jgi:hypothetical protein
MWPTTNGVRAGGKQARNYALPPGGSNERHDSMMIGALWKRAERLAEQIRIKLVLEPPPPPPEEPPP